jgi:hypothetical protein
LILLDNETAVALPKFISAQKLLEDKFILELLPRINDKNNKKIRKTKRTTIELTIGVDITCFVKPHSDFVCDTIVRGIVPKRHNGLESPTVFVLVTDNKFDFYNITETADKKYRILDRALERIIVKRVFTIHQLAHFLIIDLEKEIAKKYKSKLVVITGDFFLSDSQISKEDKYWLYPQMIQAIKEKVVANSIILVFSPTRLSHLMNYG